MTSKNTFYSLVRHLRKEEDVDIELIESHEDVDLQGFAGGDRGITMILGRKPINWELATSLLIHEFGHICLFEEVSAEDHSEKTAWEYGLNNIPVRFIPTTINEDVNYFLGTYDYDKQYTWNPETGKLN
jgi:hypothetical protein